MTSSPVAFSTHSSDCPICWSAISNRAILEPCHHQFHLECIQRWTETHSTCPFCRTRSTRITFNERSDGQFESRNISPVAPGFAHLQILMLSIAPGLILYIRETGFELINCRTSSVALTIERPGEVSLRKNMPRLTSHHLEVIRRDDKVSILGVDYPLGSRAQYLRDITDMTEGETLTEVPVRFVLDGLRSAVSFERTRRRIERGFGRTSRVRPTLSMDEAQSPGVASPACPSIYFARSVAPYVYLKMSQTGYQLLNASLLTLDVVLNRPNGASSRHILSPDTPCLELNIISSDDSVELEGNVYPLSLAGTLIDMAKERVALRDGPQVMKIIDFMPHFLCFAEELADEVRLRR